MIDPEITKALRKALMQPNAISCAKEIKGESLDELSRNVNDNLGSNYGRMEIRKWCRGKVKATKKAVRTAYNDARQVLGQYGLETPERIKP